MKGILLPSFGAGIATCMVVNSGCDYYEYVNGTNGKVVKTLRKLYSLSNNKCEQVFKPTEYYKVLKNNRLIMVILFGFIGGSLILYSLMQSFCKLLYVLSLLMFVFVCVIEGVKQKERNSFGLQFREWLYSINNSIKAGMSLEEAIRYSERDLRTLRRQFKNNAIAKCVQDTIMYLNYGKSVTEALEVFCLNSDSEDVKAFITAVKVVREKGGNMAEIIHSVSDMISEKIVLNNEIYLMLYGKQLEGKIMIFVPLLLLGLIFLISPEYIEVMFRTTAGIIIYMTSFLMIALGYALSRKITRINI